MNITVFGTGYVGLVTGVCLAELGNQVLCVDIDEEKVAALKAGKSPIYEPGLTELLEHNIAHNRIHFTSDAEQAVAHGTLHFIAVGTPPGQDGSADLSAVYSVAKTIGQNINDYGLVLNKSTVPVGTADIVRDIILRELKLRGKEVEFDIASNPEFLREGAAINDFMNPDRIIVGTDTEHAKETMRQLYTPLIDAGRRFIVMDTRSAELTKYASNAFLATKISFMNEMSHLAERLGADIEQVRAGMSMDPRIGEHFLNAGCGYGGSCFPKDVQALVKTSKSCGYHPRILTAVEEVNVAQKRILFEKINGYFNEDINGKVIALWGLSFKPNTDDLRDASSRILVEALWQKGARVQAYDPVAMDKAKVLYADAGDKIHFSESRYGALQNADALAVVTEWDEFRRPDFDFIRDQLKSPVVFDGRNLYSPTDMASHGLTYFAVGRGDRL